jgi:hypothetical protein
MRKVEENLKPSYEDARVRAYDRLVADHDHVPQYYLAVIGSTLLANMGEEEALEAIREFLDSPVGCDYIEHIQDTEDP